MFLRSSFNYDRDAVSNETALECLDESKAIQSAEEESNINTIVRRFGISGELPNQVAMPQSGDFTNIPDFHTAMNLVRQAQEEFVRIPADVRARFNNDPGRFMEFLMTLLTMMRLLSWVLSMFVPCSSIGYSRWWCYRRLTKLSIRDNTNPLRRVLLYNLFVRCCTVWRL